VGPNLIAQRPIVSTILASPGQNGFSGTVQSLERVVRYARTKTFTGTSPETFTGSVIINGIPYEGTFNMVLKFHGDLNPNLAVDAPSQGAINIYGMYRIVGRGTGALTNISGHGQINWPGGMTPVSYTGRITINP
jgi:hypothetical protein